MTNTITLTSGQVFEAVTIYTVNSTCVHFHILSEHIMHDLIYLSTLVLEGAILSVMPSSYRVDGKSIPSMFVGVKTSNVAEIK